MAPIPKKPQQPTTRPPLTRRARSRHERELRRQRQVVITASIAIGFALLAILIGVLYDQLWIPSRPVAQVDNATLSRRDYWSERRNEIARRISQNLRNLELLGSLGPQFTNQLAGQIPALNDQVPDIRTAPVDDSTVDGWIDRQLIVDGAGKLNLQTDKGEIAQQLIDDLASAFAPPPPPPTNTTTLTPTAMVSNTAALTGTTTTAPTVPSGTPATATPGGPTAAPAPSGTPASATPGGPTATQAPTNTPKPTVPPTATPLPDVALQQQDGVIGRLFDSYNTQLVNAQGRAHLTIDDFKAALYDQYLRQVLTNKIEAQLLPESQFEPSTDPSSIETRHILIAVTLPVTATDAEREAAYAKRKPEAEAILAQLHNGADFVTLAKQKSDDATTKQKGGELPAFDKEGKTQEGSVFDPAFVKAALTLKENEISDLVRTPFGWHIIQVVKRTVDTKEEQLKTARSKKFDEWLAQQRSAANIQRFPPQTPVPTAAPTPAGTAAPLPTVPLGGEPTAVPTTTLTLTNTTTLPAVTTPQTTATATAPATPSPIPSGLSPSAVLPTPPGTPRP